MITNQSILLSEAPNIAGLNFRNYQGENDLPEMLAVINAAKVAEKDERHDTLADITNMYQHLTNCDPSRDVLIVEVAGQMVGYSRVTWWIEEATGDYVYQSFGFIRPEWQRKGLGLTMLHHNMKRLSQIAAEHPTNAMKFHEVFSVSIESGSNFLFEQEGFQAIRRFFFMVRPDLENIPDLALPDGLETRPAKPEHYRQIWNANQEAFQDHWGYRQPTEEDYKAWQESSDFQPDLWQIAWDGDQVVGMILNFINHGENEEYHRLRGYTEAIAVRRAWRRRGLARALLARSLKMHRDIGMTEAALGVDSESLSGANMLYESMGFQPVKIMTSYRKPIE
jgi:mycothiol synthase